MGLDLGQLLCGAGHTEPGLEVLTRSRDGFLQLGRPDLAEQVERITAHFMKDGDRNSNG